MTVLPFPVRSSWVTDARGDGRAVRVSAHRQAGLVVLSVWSGDTCTATVRLRPDDVGAVMIALARGLVELEQAPGSHVSPAESVPPT